MKIMCRSIKLRITLCLLCLVVLLSSCFGSTDYSNSKITWSDVAQKFVELEQKKADVIGTLQDKPSLSAAKSSESAQEHTKSTK
jgi:hypothetical protein